MIRPGSPWAMKSLQLTSFHIPRLSGPQTSPKRGTASHSETKQGKASKSKVMQIQARQSKVKAHKVKTKRAKASQSETKRAKAKQNSPWQSTTAESKGKRSAHTSRAVMEHGPAQKWLSGDKVARCR